MKKNPIQVQTLKLDNVSEDLDILEIIKLSEIQTIWYVEESTSTASIKNYRLITVLKGREEKNTLCHTYKDRLTMMNRLKKILFFLVVNKEQVENEILVVTSNGIFLSSEIDFSGFNPDSVVN